MTTTRDDFLINEMNRRAEIVGFIIQTTSNEQFMVVGNHEKFPLYAPNAARWFFNTAEEVLAFLTGYAESRFYQTQEKEKERVDTRRTRGDGTAKRGKPKDRRTPSRNGK